MLTKPGKTAKVETKGKRVERLGSGLLAVYEEKEGYEQFAVLCREDGSRLTELNELYGGIIELFLSKERELSEKPVHDTKDKISQKVAGIAGRWQA